MTTTVPGVKDQRLYINGEWRDAESSREVRDRWTDTVIAVVARASAADAIDAVTAAEAAMLAPMGLPERSRVLARVATIIRDRAESFATAITSETGKPITAARGEVARAVETLSWAAEEARRPPGETIAIDAVDAGTDTIALTLAEPKGIVAAITPFNFPLNLVLHKVAPAIAAGCAVVLKPSDKAVVVAGLLVEAFEEAGLPAGRLNLVTGTPTDVVDAWINDDRVAVITFTGSSAVGWDLKQRSPRKQHILELGSNTAMVVTNHADIRRAASDAATAALSNSGQACVSLQRIYVTAAVAEEFIDAVTERFRDARAGDPRHDDTVVGPLITPSAVEQLKRSIERSVAAGATTTTGNEILDGVLTPTLLRNIGSNDLLVREEAFGPVASVLVVDDLRGAIDGVNDSEYALNTAIYTADLGEAMQFAREAEAGSVLVNMPPSFRADHMPYGGVKGSGQGVEGVRYAIDELVHQKLLVLKP